MGGPGPSCSEGSTRGLVSRPPRIAVPGVARGVFTLDPQAARHLALVLRLRAGDRFVAFDPDRGVEAEGRVVRVSHGMVDAEIGEAHEARTARRLPVLWIQGLAKGEKMDAIVRDATELGATRLVPAQTAFSVVKLDSPRAETRTKRWAKIAEEAARQCGRADPPTIDPPSSWGEALASAQESPERFCLYERATEPLGPALARGLASGAALAFAAGPEGGLSESEAREARDAGFHLVSLGELILRTETVVTAVLGAVTVISAPAGSRPG
jgi:16S rRNA (uracil1498-N3)-methyltransferase